MEYKNSENTCTFTIPDRPTVRQQLAWFSAAIGRSQEDMLARYWEGAKVLIQKWECTVMPDYKVDLDSLSDPTQTSLIIWAGLRVKEHMDKLEDLPKNS